jgi:hypothetical protein
MFSIENALRDYDSVSDSNEVTLGTASREKAMRS